MQDIIEQIGLNSAKSLHDLLAEISELTNEMARLGGRLQEGMSDSVASHMVDLASSPVVETRTPDKHLESPLPLQENTIAKGIADLYDRLGGFIKPCRESEGI